MGKSLYLINPRCDAPTYFGAEVHEQVGFAPTVLLADVAMPTIAAMAPPDFHVTLCDEGISRADLDTTADFVGITGKISQETRMIELAREFRRRGKKVIFGGCYATLSPQRLRGECDILVQGEIENIAPQLFSDLRGGTWQREYFGDKPDLRHSPIPRWDLYPNHRALSGMVQTSRGCPFECEFCDVIQYLGRKQRHKSPEQVLAELDVLYDIGYRFVFLADDNFTVYRARAKELLLALKEWNDARTQGRMSFSTQVSIDCSRDEELLQLCGEAGLVNVFVGIETPNADSLKETKKRQNIGVDMAERIARFCSHGMMVIGGMMVGFDSDTRDIFEAQYQFAMSLPIPMFTVAPLSAPQATPLFTRMQAENRLIDLGAESPAAFPWTTNLIPKQMSRADLIAGVRWLCNRLYRPAAFEYRVSRLIDLYQPPAIPPDSSGAPPSRAVDAERTAVCLRAAWLGPREEAMVARLQRRVQSKPSAAGLVLLALGYYMQIRHIYHRSGLWDPALGEQPQPLFDSSCTERSIHDYPLVTP
jgi:radical SAM superfamily enzyme YgiQ (UPF0313 family)